MTPQDFNRLQARNEELEDLVAHYKRELGILQSTDQRAALTRSIHLTDTEASILLALHARAGGVQSKDALMNALYSDAADEPEPKIIDVFICKLRRKIGADKIITAWGLGYRLSREGVAFVAAALAGDDAPVSGVSAIAVPVWIAHNRQANRAVLERLLERGSQTCDEIARVLRQPGVTVRVRLNHLIADGLIEMTRLARPGRGGWPAKYGATPAAAQWLVSEAGQAAA